MESKIKLTKNSMTLLKGITWDHPRGYQPLRAAAACWEERTGHRLEWDVRTLKEFGDLPVEKLIDRYDLLIIDHPYMGEAGVNGYLLPLNDFLGAGFLASQQKQSVGPSYESYSWGGKHYALPVDAAAQVAVCRRDITDALGWHPPLSTLHLREAAGLLPHQYKMAIPLCPTDIWCVFLTLCAQFTAGNFFTADGIDAAAGCWALGQLKQWQSFLHTDSLRLNPIQLLDKMALEENIVYCPFSFGYTNYSRKEFPHHRLTFIDAPRCGTGEVSTLLGGAGIAVSSKSTQRDACFDFIRYVLDPDIQRTVYYENGGQPAHLTTWLDPACNKDCGHFFAGTLDTLQHACRRSGVPGFNRFQEQGADHIHDAVVKNREGQSVLKQLNNLYQTLCHAII